MNAQQIFNTILLFGLGSIGVILYRISNISQSSRLRDKYFDIQARDIQRFLENFLGRDFNVDCKFANGTPKREFYHLWIWKLYETRDMGCVIHADSIPSLIQEFMRIYYTQPYFTDATAFPKR